MSTTTTPRPPKQRRQQSNLELPGRTWQHAADAVWDQVRAYLRGACFNRGVPRDDWDDLLADAAVHFCRAVRALWATGRRLNVHFLTMKVFQYRARRYRMNQRVRAHLEAARPRRLPSELRAELRDLRIDLGERDPQALRLIDLRLAGHSRRAICNRLHCDTATLARREADILRLARG